MSELSPLRAIVLDDDPDFVNILSVVLKTAGVSVSAYSTPQQFLAAVASTPPSICFVDLQIGGVMAGFEVIRSLRAKVGDALPILVVSAFSETRIIAHAMELGADDFLVKPIDSAVLGAKLKFALSRARAEKLPVQTIPLKDAPLKLGLELAILSVDELGIEVQSRHLFKKGQMVTLESPYIQELTGGPSAEVVIKNTSANPGTGTWRAYAEFDPENKPVLEGVRRWLIKKAG